MRDSVEPLALLLIRWYFTWLCDAHHHLNKLIRYKHVLFHSNIIIIIINIITLPVFIQFPECYLSIDQRRSQFPFIYSLRH